MKSATKQLVRDAVLIASATCGRGESLIESHCKDDVAQMFGATPTYKRTSRKVGRNEPCPCNSGKKYKKCCGV